MKKQLTVQILLVVCLILAISACLACTAPQPATGSAAVPVEEATSAAEEPTAVEEGADDFNAFEAHGRANRRPDITKDNVKIGFIHYSDISDMGFTYSNYQGTLEMMKVLGLREDQVITKFNVPEDSASATTIKELIEEGCDLVFACGSVAFGDNMLECAREYPNIEFYHTTGWLAPIERLPNFHNSFAKAYQARYLAGIAAGLKTKTNKLGYVGAFPYAEVISGFSAFYLGAKSVNPDVTMDVIYTNSWGDAMLEDQAATALIQSGCDVLSQHSSSTAVATAAEKNGVWHIGYNVDLTDVAPNAFLLSACVDWSKDQIHAVSYMIENKDIETDWSGSYMDGACYLTPLNTAVAADGTQEAIDAAVAKLESGWDVFTGPLKDSQGNIIVEDGVTFHEPTSCPTWEHILEGVTVVGE